MTSVDSPHGPAPSGPGPRPPAPAWWWGALAGLTAVGAALALGTLVTGVVEGTSSPVVSVGEVVVEHAPAWLKDFAIATFGQDDKPALVAGTTVVLVVLSAVVGVASTRRWRAGVVGTLVLGAVGVVSAVSRPDAPAGAALPSLVGTAGALAVLALLVGPRRTSAPPVPVAERSRPAPPPTGFDRRRFLLSAGLVAGGAAVAGGVGRALQRRFDVAGAREALVLPSPSSPGEALAAGVDLATEGVTPFTTPNGSFYRVDTALVVPRISPEQWSLDIGGMVERPLRLSFEELLDRELIERDITLVCVSNEVGGRYAGNARWLGVPLRGLLEEAGVQPGADQLVSRSVDGWTAGTPTAIAMDGRDAMVAVGMNGEPLPVQHGFPARLVVPGLYGYTSATKWLTRLELTTFDAYDAYWVTRGWAPIAPIKTMARIDTPKGSGRLDAGTVPIGGVAWAVHRGISAVEVRVDDGPWLPARLGDAPGDDTWRQWVLPWDATSGRHTITARALDGRGVVQTEQRADPAPDGATGWHSVVVEVR